MSRNGSGTYTPPAADFPAVASSLIESAKYNAVINDIATALTGSIAADGQTSITANLPMSTYRHTGVGDAAALTDYSSAGQIVKNSLVYAASSAGSDAYAISLTIAPSAYTAGMKFTLKADVDNTGACTLNINSLGAKNILLTDGSTPLNGHIQANGIYDLVYDGTQFLLLNPSYADNIVSVSASFTNITFGGTAISATAAEINYNAGVTPGTVAASKTLIVDASKNIGTFGTVTAGTFVGALTGNVTGNCTGSSGSCTGNATTATTAGSITGQGALATLNTLADTNDLPPVTAGNYVAALGMFAYTSTQGDAVPLSFTKMLEFEIPTDGTYRIIMYPVLGTGNNIWRVYKNGAALGSTHTNPTVGTWTTEDQALVKGDLLQLYIYGGASVDYMAGGFGLAVAQPINPAPVYTNTSNTLQIRYLDFTSASSAGYHNVYIL